jgi:hypothetical protein
MVNLDRYVVITPSSHYRLNGFFALISALVKKKLPTLESITEVRYLLLHAFNPLLSLRT